jgi:response regulator of citrate/malate metabolism
MTTPTVGVLVVDDDFRIAAINAAYVQRVDGFDVVGQAHTAAHAMTSIDALRPDLILLDLYLPDENGLDLMRRLADRTGSRPDVLAVTAARDVTSVRTAMQLGAVSYLVKPFPSTALRDRLAAYRQLRQRLTALSEADQADVDELFGLLRTTTHLTPPKGHSAPTLALVREAVRGAGRDVSAAEVATMVGISRPTAQRYLTFLEQHGIVTLHLRYGTTGRPEHRYSNDPRRLG